MTTAEKTEKTYDAWQAPHLKDGDEAQNAAPKKDLGAQISDLQAEQDALSEEERLAMRVAPQGFNAPQQQATAATKPEETADAVTESLTDEEEHPESEMVREASPFVRELIGALKTVYDPEIPVDIFELGLIYRIDVDDNKNVTIDMTLTAPGCPVAGEMPIMVENAIKSVQGVGEVDINMVFDPPWSPEKMSEEAQLSLNMF